MKKLIVLMVLIGSFGCSKEDDDIVAEENFTGIVKYVVDTNQDAFYVTFLNESNLRQALHIEDSHWEYSFETDSEIVYAQVQTYIAGSSTDIYIYFNDEMIYSLGCSDNHPAACLAVGKTR